MREEDAHVCNTAAGFDLTQPINRLVECKDKQQLSARLGPDEWLLTTPDCATATHLPDELTTWPHSLVDISHRNVAIELTGDLAADVLNTGCPLDLRCEAFPVGMATRTLFSKSEIILMRREDLNGVRVYRLECWRSFARYLASHLRNSAQLLGLPA